MHFPMTMIRQLTSAFMISTDLSFPCELNRSTSGPLLSKVHTETRLLVTLCDPDCTFHSPMQKTGVVGAEAVGTPFVPGVDGLLA